MTTEWTEPTIPCLGWWPTGSRYICSPAPTDTDKDTVIYVERRVDAIVKLYEQGWNFNGEDYGVPDKKEEEWFSVKKTINGILENYIVTQNKERFYRWVTATELAKKLNLLKKEDRISLFNVIVDGEKLY